MYNPSPISYSSIDSPSTLTIVKGQLIAETKHILLGDFNLHYLLWNHSSRPTQHAESEKLLNIIEEANLSLTIPKGTIISEARKSSSTIDLVFISEELTDRI